MPANRIVTGQGELLHEHVVARDAGAADAGHQRGMPRVAQQAKAGDQRLGDGRGLRPGVEDRRHRGAVDEDMGEHEVLALLQLHLGAADGGGIGAGGERERQQRNSEPRDRGRTEWHADPGKNPRGS